MVLVVMAGLCALSGPLSDRLFVRNLMWWWYAGVLASIGIAYVLVVRLFPMLFVKCWPRQHPRFIVYLIFASGLYAVIATGLLWLRGIAAQS